MNKFVIYILDASQVIRRIEVDIEAAQEIGRRSPKNPTEAMAMYIAQQIENQYPNSQAKQAISKIAHVVPYMNQPYLDGVVVRVPGILDQESSSGSPSRTKFPKELEDLRTRYDNQLLAERSNNQALQYAVSEREMAIARLRDDLKSAQMEKDRLMQQYYAIKYDFDQLRHEFEILMKQKEELELRLQNARSTYPWADVWGGGSANTSDSTRVTDTEKDNLSTLHLQITEKPLTPQNLAVTLTVLTELTTKFWLIAKRRLPDLIEYAQTHDVRFSNEAGIVITRATYNSPFNFDWKVDISAPSVAEAIGTAIDAIKQRNERLKKLELENQEKAQRIKDGEHNAELERMKEELAIERERVKLLRETMELQKQGIEYALEIASKLVDTLYPNANAEIKGVMIQSLLPSILQLQNIKGLELPSPAPNYTIEETTEKGDYLS